MKVLVKVRGYSPKLASVHAYDADAGHALCSKWIAPGRDWEVQEHDVERITQIPRYCSHCEQRLRPAPVRPRKATRKMQQYESEMERLRRWMRE